MELAEPASSTTGANSATTHGHFPWYASVWGGDPKLNLVEGKREGKECFQPRKWTSSMFATDTKWSVFAVGTTLSRVVNWQRWGRVAVATSLSLAAVFCMISHNFHLPLETKRTHVALCTIIGLYFTAMTYAQEIYYRYEIRCRMKRLAGETEPPVCVKHQWRHCWRMPLKLNAPMFVFITIKNPSSYLRIDTLYNSWPGLSQFLVKNGPLHSRGTVPWPQTHHWWNPRFQSNILTPVLTTQSPLPR